MPFPPQREFGRGPVSLRRVEGRRLEPFALAHAPSLDDPPRTARLFLERRPTGMVACASRGVAIWYVGLASPHTVYPDVEGYTLTFSLRTSGGWPERLDFALRTGGVYRTVVAARVGEFTYQYGTPRVRREERRPDFRAGAVVRTFGADPVLDPVAPVQILRRASRGFVRLSVSAAPGRSSPKRNRGAR